MLPVHVVFSLLAAQAVNTGAVCQIKRGGSGQQTWNKPGFMYIY